MTKTKFTSLAVATEKASAKRERRLPEGLPTTNCGATLSPESSRNTILAFLLSDVIYSLLYDVSIEMSSVGREIKQDSKQRFNHLFATVEKAKTAALRSSKDIIGLDQATQHYFVDDAERMRELTELIYDRSRASDDAPEKIKAILSDLPKFRP